MDFEKMRKRVELQSVTETTSGLGETSRAWATYATVWASIKQLTGRELFYSQQVHSEATTQITIRYSSAVVTKNRVLFGARIFQILDIKNIDEKNERLELLTVEVKE
jgi:SPP1 family predicted phage head-tail adaptor